MRDVNSVRHTYDGAQLLALYRPSHLGQPAQSRNVYGHLEYWLPVDCMFTMHAVYVSRDCLWITTVHIDTMLEFTVVVDLVAIVVRRLSSDPSATAPSSSTETVQRASSFRHVLVDHRRCLRFMPIAIRRRQ